MQDGEKGGVVAFAAFGGVEGPHTYFYQTNPPN